MEQPSDSQGHADRRQYVSQRHDLNSSYQPMNQPMSSGYHEESPQVWPPYPPPSQWDYGPRSDASWLSPTSKLTRPSIHPLDLLASEPYMTQSASSPIRPSIDLVLNHPQSVATTFLEDNVIEVPPEPPNSSEKIRRPAPRQSALKLPEWDKHKEEIKRLYIDESKSLQETRDAMSSEFHFTASVKLYKEKLSEWGLTKYVPSSTAVWILENEKERRQKGKTQAAYHFGGRPLDMVDVQRKVKRAKVNEDSNSKRPVRTPDNLVYETPKTFVFSPLSPGNFSRDANVQVVQRSFASNWAPPQRSDRSQARWSGYTRRDLSVLHEDALNLARLEQFEEAEAKFCEVLEGSEYILSLEHEDTLAVAYGLAKFYARCNRMSDADAVLDWLRKEHLRTWGIDDERTAAHMSRVVELLCSWSRPEDAKALVNKKVSTSQKLAQTKSVASSLQLTTHKPVDSIERRENLDVASSTPTSFVPYIGDELSKVNYQLRQAKLHSRALDKEAEPLLLHLIEKCQRHPEKLAIQHFDACCTLVELYQNQKPGDFQKLYPALKSTEELFWQIVQRKLEMPMLLKLALKLVRMSVIAELNNSAKLVLARIENEAADLIDQERGSFIDILVALGTYYQDHNSWSNAERYFEHALAISMRVHELDCRVVRTLEWALENKRFQLFLPTSDNAMASFRDNRFKRCGCGNSMGEFGSRF